MTSTTRKVDGKGRVILPDKFAGQIVAIEPVSDTEVRIRMAPSPRRRPSLSMLLFRVTKANRHGEAGFGPPVGEEQL